VRFVGETEHSQLWSQVGQRAGNKGAFQHLRIFLDQCVRQDTEVCTATPVAGPNDLRHDWKCALRQAMEDASDWRNPQIVVPMIRRAEWPEHEEVEVRFDPCENRAARVSDRRVLAVLDFYESHRFAKSDFDPWDLQRTHPPAANAPAHQRHPCSLPKPPSLKDVRLDDLPERIAALHGWGIGGRYYFLPPSSWRPDAASRQDWRDGRAFQRQPCPHCGKQRPSDYKDDVWCWDETERHWDVQHNGGGYSRISHDGAAL